MKQETKDKIQNIKDKISRFVIILIIYLNIFVIVESIFSLFKGKDILAVIRSTLLCILMSMYVIWSFSRKNPLKVIKDYFVEKYEKTYKFFQKFKKEK